MINLHRGSLLRRQLPAFLGLALLAICQASALATVVRFTTSVGNVDVRLYNAATPNSVANFLFYVNNNRYSGSFVHRVPQIGKDQLGNNLGTSHFVVQGGGFLLNNNIFSAAGITTNPPIGDEPGISNTRGTIAFAKNSLGATSQWFFNIGDNSFLNAQGFTVFGRVVGSGMTVVDAIDNLPAANKANAQNAAGEDFDEVPVRNLQQVNSSGTITANEAVMVNVSVLNLPLGDYDFNGIVNSADYTVYRNTYGSTTNAAADGNGDGRVDGRDYLIWRNTLSGSGAGSNDPGGTVPEPNAALLLICGVLPLVARRRRAIA